MRAGTVRIFNEAKEYGFITEDDTNRDISVHRSGLGDLIIRKNDRVKFIVVEGTKRSNAVQIRNI